MSDTTIGTEVHDDSPDHSQPVLEVQGLTKSFGRSRSCAVST